MNVHFFWSMLAFGTLIGGGVGGTNWKHYFKAFKNDTDRDQKKVGKHIVIGMMMGAVVGALIGFFVPFLYVHHLL